MYAYGEALRHLERALALWDRVPDAAERAGMPRSDVLRRPPRRPNDGFESARAIALQREALDAADGADPVELARMHAELAHYLRHANEHDASDDEIAPAVELLPAEPARARAAARPELQEPDAARALRGAAPRRGPRRRRGGSAPDLEAGAANTEGISRGALGDVDEGARLLRRARDLALEIGSPAEQCGRRQPVRAARPVGPHRGGAGRGARPLPVSAATERSLYDTFLELQGASQLLRLGRTAEAAADARSRARRAITRRHVLRGDARDVALLRGDDDAARRRSRRSAAAPPTGIRSGSRCWRR